MNRLEHQHQEEERSKCVKKLLDLTHELYKKLPVQAASDLEGELEAAIAEYGEIRNTAQRDVVLEDIEYRLVSTISHMLELKRLTQAEAEVYYQALEHLGLTKGGKHSIFGHGTIH